jgi:hypothetical protein
MRPLATHELNRTSKRVPRTLIRRLRRHLPPRGGRISMRPLATHELNRTSKRVPRTLIRRLRRHLPPRGGRISMRPLATHELNRTSKRVPRILIRRLRRHLPPRGEGYPCVRSQRMRHRSSPRTFTARDKPLALRERMAAQRPGEGLGPGAVRCAFRPERLPGALAVAWVPSPTSGELDRSAGLPRPSHEFNGVGATTTWRWETPSRTVAPGAHRIRDVVTSLTGGRSDAENPHPSASPPPSPSGGRISMRPLAPTLCLGLLTPFTKSVALAQLAAVLRRPSRLAEPTVRHTEAHGFEPASRRHQPALSKTCARAFARSRM